MSLTTTNYEGVYDLKALFGERHIPISIPVGSNYVLKINKKSNDDEDREDGNTNIYSFGITIGNSLGCSMTVTPKAPPSPPSLRTPSADSVQFGPVISKMFTKSKGRYQMHWKELQ